MDLKILYDDVSKLLKKIDFSALWPGFKPLKFALYDEKKCFFNGEYIEKSDQFLANTSIFYNGEYVAIWDVQEDMPIEVLVSKMVHEMFHGFQMQNHESRFPNELSSLETYRYLDENLSMKHLESQLLIRLSKSYSEEAYKEFLSIRRYRRSKFNEEFEYEARIEQIEGTANFIELSVLRQISPESFSNKLEEMEKRLSRKESYLPVRIVSYDIGALLLLVLKSNDLPFDSSFNDVPFSVSLLEGASDKNLDLEFGFKDAIDAYYHKAEEMIERAVKRNDLAVEGRHQLSGFNIYNAVYLKPYIVSEYFVMYKEGDEEKVLYGDFVIEMDEGVATKIYRFEK